MTQTNWDLIRDAASGSATAQASLDAVMKRAWPAVYAYIRASGRRSEEATELTQAFICDVFLSRHLLEKADQARGRFRTLLLGAVRNYLADVHRRRHAQSRMPKGGLVAIEAAVDGGADFTSDGGDGSPERISNAVRLCARLGSILRSMLSSTSVLAGVAPGCLSRAGSRPLHRVGVWVFPTAPPCFWPSGPLAALARCMAGSEGTSPSGSGWWPCYNVGPQPCSRDWACRAAAQKGRWW
jgi:DNA-directed RNA polymerase specialized sigma24 family protein